MSIFSSYSFFQQLWPQKYPNQCHHERSLISCYHLYFNCNSYQIHTVWTLFLPVVFLLEGDCFFSGFIAFSFFLRSSTRWSCFDFSKQFLKQLYPLVPILRTLSRIIRFFSEVSFCSCNTHIKTWNIMSGVQSLEGHFHGCCMLILLIFICSLWKLDTWNKIWSHHVRLWSFELSGVKTPISESNGTPASILHRAAVLILSLGQSHTVNFLDMAWMLCQKDHTA